MNTAVPWQTNRPHEVQQAAGAQSRTSGTPRDCGTSGDSPGQKPQEFLFLVHQMYRGDHWQMKVSQLLEFMIYFCILDTLSKEEFHLKQNVEPFIHYKEKQATFECITRENIEAVASKVFD